MIGILNFMMANLTAGLIEHTEEIKSTTERYFSDVPSAALLSNDLPSWSKVQFSFPLVIINKSVVNSTVVSSPAVIADTRGNIEILNILKDIKGGADVKVVVILPPEDEKIVMTKLRKIGVCQLLMIKMSTDTYNETLPEEPCSGMNLWKFKETEFHHCKANVSFFDFPPRTIFKGDRLAGTEGLMVQTIADQLGMELKYINRHETEYGQFEPPSGLMGDVGSGSSIIGVGAIYPFVDRWLHADLVFSCSTVDLAFAVPVGAGAVQPTWFLILVTEFSPVVWLCSLAAYLVLIPVSMLLRRDRGNYPQWPFYIFALMLGVPQRFILQRRVALLVVLYGFILTLHYQTVMSSKLTSPSKIPEISNLKQLARSSLRVEGIPSAGKLLNLYAQADPENADLADLSHRYQTNTQDLNHVLPAMVQNRDVAYLRHGDNMNYHAQKDPRTAGQIHIVEETTVTFSPVTMMPRHSCLTRKFQEGYSRLCESGLSSKWVKDLNPVRKHDTQRGPQKLTLAHIQGFLYLLAFGWTTSISVFIVEVALNYIAAKRKNITQTIVTRFSK